MADHSGPLDRQKKYFSEFRESDEKIARVRSFVATYLIPPIVISIRINVALKDPCDVLNSGHLNLLYRASV